MKIQMIRFLTLCSLVFLLVSGAGSNSFAEARNSAEMKNSVENHLNQLLRVYDERAFSLVILNEEKVSENLPGTPFSYENLVISNTEDPSRQKLKITVFESKKETEAKTGDLIKGVLKDAGFSQATVAFSLLPEVEMSKPVVQTGSQEYSAVTRSEILAGIFAISLLLGLIAFRSRKIESSLGAGFKQLSETIQSSAENSERSHSSAPVEQAHAQVAPSGVSGAVAIQQFSETALFACFTDCYWVKNDSYGSYLWQNMSVVQRKGLLKAHPFLVEYASWLANQTPIDQGCIMDPYYLEPGSLALVDQEKLQQWVSEKPEWFFAVSKLRSENLELPVSERMKIFEARTELMESAAVLKMDLIPVESPEPRKLPSSFKIQLRTLEEEQQFLSHENLAPEMLIAADTLGVLLKLPEARIESILNRYTARDLVSAWIAPADVLTGLEKFISPKKLEVVRSYHGKIQPSRDSRAYKEIIALAHEVLHSMMKETSNEARVRKAA